MHDTLTSTTTQDQSGPGSNEEVLQTPQSFKITALPLDTV